MAKTGETQSLFKDDVSTFPRESLPSVDPAFSLRHHPLFPPSLWLEETRKLCPYLGWNLFIRFLALFSRSSGPVPNWSLQNSHDLCWKWVLEVRWVEVTSRVTEPWALERLIQWEGSPGGRRTWRQGPGSYRARLRLRGILSQGPPLKFSSQHYHFALWPSSFLHQPQGFPRGARAMGLDGSAGSWWILAVFLAMDLQQLGYEVQKLCWSLPFCYLVSSSSEPLSQELFPLPFQEARASREKQWSNLPKVTWWADGIQT